MLDVPVRGAPRGHIILPGSGYKWASHIPPLDHLGFLFPHHLPQTTQIFVQPATTTSTIATRHQTTLTDYQFLSFRFSILHIQAEYTGNLNFQTANIINTNSYLLYLSGLAIQTGYKVYFRDILLLRFINQFQTS